MPFLAGAGAAIALTATKFIVSGFFQSRFFLPVYLSFEDL
jgi:hypothetical protein